MYVCVSVCVYIYICAYICMYVFMCVCMYMYIYIYMYICIYIYIHIYNILYIYMYIYIYIYLYTIVLTYIYFRFITAKNQQLLNSLWSLPKINKPISWLHSSDNGSATRKYHWKLKLQRAFPDGLNDKIGKENQREIEIPIRTSFPLLKRNKKYPTILRNQAFS